jgi:hypothetical protein
MSIAAAGHNESKLAIVLYSVTVIMCICTALNLTQKSKTHVSSFPRNILSFKIVLIQNLQNERLIAIALPTLRASVCKCKWHLQPYFLHSTSNEKYVIKKTDVFVNSPE